MGINIIKEGIDKGKGVHFPHLRQVMIVNIDKILEVVHYLQSIYYEGEGNHTNDQRNVDSLNEML